MDLKQNVGTVESDSTRQTTVKNAGSTNVQSAENVHVNSRKTKKESLTEPLKPLLLSLLETQKYPLNTCQICRLLNGAKDKNDIGFCRTNKVRERGLSNFTRWGHQPYEHCVCHQYRNDKVRGVLRTLEKQGKIKSVYLRHHDPQKKGRHWDRMRFYAISDLSPILKQHIPFYFGVEADTK